MPIQQVLGYIRSSRSTYLEELTAYLKFASVSADSAYRSSLLACAAFTKQCLIDCGLTDVTYFETDGHPVLFGQTVQDPSKPTVLVYGHYDVQPPDPLDLWKSGPFDPEIREGYLYARGASDDKGQIFCHLKAIQAWLKVSGELPVNIKVIIEGEEEIGSKNLSSFLKANASLLKADVALVSDTPMLGLGQPSICTSLRGLLYVQVTVKGANSDLHSGQHGGATPNAIHGLMTILDQLKDEDGQVTIPGFYEDVAPISPEVHDVVLSLGHDDEAYKHALGVDELVGEKGFHTLERRWYRPTLDVNGIWGGYTGEGSKTVIPSLAHAKFSMRLVSKQNPHKILNALKIHLETLCPAGYTITMSDEYEAAFPAVVDGNLPAVKAGLAALESAFSSKAVLQGEGGTIPIVSEFKSSLGLETVLMGFNLPDDCIHAPNERFLVDNFYRGIEASAYFFENYKQEVNL